MEYEINKRNHSSFQPCFASGRMSVVGMESKMHFLSQVVVVLEKKRPVLRLSLVIQFAAVRDIKPCSFFLLLLILLRFIIIIFLLLILLLLLLPLRLLFLFFLQKASDATDIILDIQKSEQKLKA